MSDEKKTREQLLAEIEQLKQQLAQADAEAAAGNEPPPAATAAAPASGPPAAHITRRQALWVGPVVLALPVVQAAVGAVTVLNPKPAVAAPNSADPIKPRVASTRPSTSRPTSRAPTTRRPTAAPTLAPTAAPTQAPTMAGHCVPAPTAAPTLGLASVPDCGPGTVAAIALGGARALATVSLRAA